MLSIIPWSFLTAATPRSLLYTADVSRVASECLPRIFRSGKDRPYLAAHDKAVDLQLCELSEVPGNNSLMKSLVSVEVTPRRQRFPQLSIALSNGWSKNPSKQRPTSARAAATFGGHTEPSTPLAGASSGSNIVFLRVLFAHLWYLVCISTKPPRSSTSLMTRWINLKSECLLLE